MGMWVATLRKKDVTTTFIFDVRISQIHSPEETATATSMSDYYTGALHS